MEKVSILHLITAEKNASPFDVNMAFDAGFDKIMPYTNVEMREVMGLVQDAIFSRGPSGIKRESVFIGGRDIDIAMDMLNAAKKAMVPPFEVSVFADPSGAFTTAAGMMAKVEQHLTKNFGGDLTGRRVSVFGATGPVGGCTAVIAAKYGARVQLVSHRSMTNVQAKVDAYNARYSLNIVAVDGASDVAKIEVLKNTEIALCAAAAGVQVMSLAQMAQAKDLKIVADVNAVPPTGAEGVDVFADGTATAGTTAFGIGALVIGNVKYKTQHNLLKLMLESEKKQYLDFLSAFEMARKSL
ncbi:MAG: methylenetetrahydromethanopterin dehydrogenase [Candidatus Methylopumilus sp.]|nr:methylenetetrahydromethanopterin dehydrogenase [Candidatus Methylopumilus sp.]